MQNCAGVCGEIPLINNPTEDCTKVQRYKNIDRLVFKPCDVDLPDPETNIAMKALFDAGSLSFTSSLANVALGDPTTEDIQISDCAPPYRLITGRQLTAEDRIKVTLTEGSPAIAAQYRDYDVWQNKIDQQANMHVGIKYCDGDVVWAKDADGNFLKASVLVFLNYQRPANGSGKFVEFKSVQVDFNGDPIALYNKPSWNTDAAGIVL